MLCARAAVDRATLAKRTGDEARVTSELARFDALWPHPDATLPLVVRAAALRAPKTTTPASSTPASPAERR